MHNTLNYYKKNFHFLWIHIIKKDAKLEGEKGHCKNTSRTKKIPILKLDNNDKIAAKIVYTKDNGKCFRVNDIDINKIRISEKSLYSKQHNAYKCYVLYEHNNEYMPL